MWTDSSLSLRKGCGPCSRFSSARAIDDSATSVASAVNHAAAPRRRPTGGRRQRNRGPTAGPHRKYDVLDIASVGRGYGETIARYNFLLAPAGSGIGVGPDGDRLPGAARRAAHAGGTGRLGGRGRWGDLGQR